MVKVVLNVGDSNNSIYVVPVFGPLIAMAEGVAVRVMFGSALKVIQGGALGFAWLFNIENVTEIDYDIVIWSGFDLTYNKGLGGIQNQTLGAYNCLFSSNIDSDDANSNKVVVDIVPVDSHDSADISISGSTYDKDL